MTWTKDQLDFRRMILRILETHWDARATVLGINRIFPPIEQPTAMQVRWALADSLENRRPSPLLQDPKTTWELLQECFREAGVTVEAEIEPPPYGLNHLRFYRTASGK